MGRERYVLMCKEVLAETELPAYCLCTAREIIETCQSMSVKSLGKARLAPKDMKGDLCRNLRRRQKERKRLLRRKNLTVEEVTEGFRRIGRRLFLKTVYFVTFHADFVLQLSIHKAAWSEVRGRFQRGLLLLLRDYLNLGEDELAELDHELVERSEEYGLLPDSNAVALRGQVGGSVTGDPLLFSIAACAYVGTALAARLGPILIYEGDPQSEVTTKCRRCQKPVAARSKPVPFHLVCENCGARFEVANVI